MRVGFVQNNPVFANIQENLSRVEKLLAGQSADLFVLPELFATGYQFKDQEESRSLAELVPRGVTTKVSSPPSPRKPTPLSSLALSRSKGIRSTILQ